MKAESGRKAFEKAFEILGAGVEKDEEATKRAGYPIYRSTKNGAEWVSDLGNRLEVNTADGESVCIWIETEEAPTSETTTPEKPLATVESDLTTAETITAEEYNERRAGLGWCVRFAFGRWVVCDGKAPEGVRVGVCDVFIGTPLKWCDTMKEADALRDLLNA